jgi:hypothetical protein
VYARLVGTSWQGKFGSRATRWGVGNQMIEDDSSFGQSVITPGQTPGTLTLKLGSSNLHTFQGTIASDGSVLWVRDGRLKMPYRVALRDNELVEEAVKLSGPEVVAVKRTMRYQQVQGPRIASQSSASPTPVPMAPVAAANPPTANPAAAAPAAAPSTPAIGFGPFAALDGQQFVGDTLALKIYTSNGGRTLSLDHQGVSVYVLNATDVPGTYFVAAHPNMLHEYHVEDSFVGRLNADGAIEIRYQTRGVSGSKYATDHYRFDGYSIVKSSFSESRRGRTMVGSPKVYVPATPELLQVARANAISSTRAREEGEIENRRAEAESNRALAQSFNNMLGDLQDAGGYSEAQANLDATVANIQRAAATPQQQYTPPVGDQRVVARTQPQRVQQPSDVTAPAAAPSSTGATSSKPLRFVMIMGMRNLPGDKVNSTCYSNVVTRDGPPGWGGSDYRPAASEQASQVIGSLKAQFIAACQASGRQISSEGNFHWVWNLLSGDEQKMANARVKYAEDVSVSIQ